MFLFDTYSKRLISFCPFLTFPEKAMDYHQKALNISKKSSSGAGKAMAAETCVLMGMVKCKMGSFKSALNVRSYRTSLIVFMFGNTETEPQLLLSLFYTAIRGFITCSRICTRRRSFKCVKDNGPDRLRTL